MGQQPCRQGVHHDAQKSINTTFPRKSDNDNFVPLLKDMSNSGARVDSISILPNPVLTPIPVGPVSLFSDAQARIAINPMTGKMVVINNHPRWLMSFVLLGFYWSPRHQS